MAVALLLTLIVIAMSLVGISGSLRRIEQHNAKFVPPDVEEPEEGAAGCPCQGVNGPERPGTSL